MERQHQGTTQESGMGFNIISGDSKPCVNQTGTIRNIPERGGEELFAPYHSRLRKTLAEAIYEGGKFDEISSADIENLKTLLTRLDEGRFHMAAVGQFKRGKSTLINSLIGENVLPSAVVPLTSIPTFVKSGERKCVTVKFNSGEPPVNALDPDKDELKSFLSQYVTEEENPNNIKNVAQVEVTHTSPLLNHGVVLIDTPGIGSTFRHNTEATINFLPQCDAALFVVSSDPPVTQVELEFLNRIRARIARLFIVFNKSDYLDSEERTQALQFLEKVLIEQAGFDPVPPVFCVSAKQALKARLDNDKRLWAESGMNAIETRLLSFLSHEKYEVLGDALAGKMIDIFENILLRIRLKKKSYLLPLEELKKRIGLFEKVLTEINRDRLQLSDILEGEQKRMLESLESYCKEVREKTRERLAGKAHESERERACGGIDEKTMEDALAREIPVVFEREMGGAIDRFGRAAEAALKPHFQKADAMIESIRQTASELFEITAFKQTTSHLMKIVRPPYWVTEKWETSMSLLPASFFDAFLPGSFRRARIEKRIMTAIEDMVSRNVENMRWSVKLPISS